MGELLKNQTEIQKFYSGTTVFLTGATGFLGKIVLEKLLRSCDVETVYVLMREKKGKPVEDRLEEMFKAPLFDKLKGVNPNFQKRIHIIKGDCGQPDLGLSDFDRQTLIDEVDCLFHVAASVNFLEKLEVAAKINVRGTRDIMKLAKEMKKVKAVIYVSSAYSNCIHKQIDEKFYDPPMSAKELIEAVESEDPEDLRIAMKKYMKKWPNSYVFTKSIAESVVREEGKDLPVAIVRPSLVGSTNREPVPGWVDAFYGPSGFLQGVGLGLIHSLQMGPNNKCDFVPADYVVNNILAVAWEIGKIKNETKDLINEECEENGEKKEQDVPIYNFVCTPENPLNWDTTYKLSAKHSKKFVSSLMMWYPFVIITKSKFAHFFNIILFHFLPAIFLDIGAFILGKSPMMVKIYKKVHKISQSIVYFATRDWNFTNDHTQKLWEKLSEEDKQEFEFSMKKVNWDLFFHNSLLGTRIYLLKDPLSTLPAAIGRYRKLTMLHWLLVIFLLFLFYKFCQYLLYTFYFD